MHASEIARQMTTTARNVSMIYLFRNQYRWSSKLKTIENIHKKLRKNYNVFTVYNAKHILNYLNCSALKNKLIYLCDHGKKRNQSANKNQHKVLIICFTE